jgi:hypothetical protein
LVLPSAPSPPPSPPPRPLPPFCSQQPPLLAGRVNHTRPPSLSPSFPPLPSLRPSLPSSSLPSSSSARRLSLQVGEGSSLCLRRSTLRRCVAISI